MQNKHLGMQRARFEARGVFAIGLRPCAGDFRVLERVEVPEYTQNRDGPFMDLHLDARSRQARIFLVFLTKLVRVCGGCLGTKRR